jgi:hypothetical protein
MFSERDAHQLPPDTRWAQRYRCMHKTVENADRADLPRYFQRCMCGAVVMGFRCPDCQQTY